MQLNRAQLFSSINAVVHKPEAELASALDRLIAAGLLFRQGVPPYVDYLFKHALVQDAAYGTLLREATTRAPCPHRRNTRKPVPGDKPRSRSPSCWRVTAPKLGRAKKRWACGARRDSGRSNALR